MKKLIALALVLVFAVAGCNCCPFSGDSESTTEKAPETTTK